MAQLVVRNLDDGVKRKLQVCARRHFQDTGVDLVDPWAG